MELNRPSRPTKVEAVEMQSCAEPQHPKARNFAIAVAALTLLFAKPLFDLARFAFQSDTYSHVILIPFVCGYLVALRRNTALGGSTRPAFIPLAVGAALTAAGWVLKEPE